MTPSPSPLKLLSKIGILVKCSLILNQWFLKPSLVAHTRLVLADDSRSTDFQLGLMVLTLIGMVGFKQL